MREYLRSQPELKYGDILVRWPKAPLEVMDFAFSVFFIAK